MPYLLGKMENALETAQVALQGMIEGPTNAILTCKTMAAQAAIQTIEKALEVLGGAGFFHSRGLECLWRDMQGTHFPPLSETRQLLFTSRLALGLAPVD